MPKYFRIAVYFLGVSILLLIVAYNILIYTLEKNGITFADKDFSLPFNLKVKDLQINKAGLTAHITEIELNLSVANLIRGRIKGDYLVIQQGVILQTNSNQNKVFEKTSFEDIIPINFDRIQLFNIKYQFNADDTLALTIPDLLIKNISLGSTWHVDSLINKGSKLEFVHHPFRPVNAGKATPSKTPSALILLPEFSINTLNFRDCNFNFRSPSQHHSITNLNLNLTGIKQDSLINMSANELSLTYQDTLDVDLTLNQVLINNQLQAKISNLNFDFPWLKLHIPELELSNKGSPAIQVLFDESYVNTALFKFFLPTVDLSRELGLNFKGNVFYSNGQIDFDHFVLNLTNKSSLVLNGFAALPGKSSGNIQLNLLQVHTSSSELSELFGFNPLPNQKEITINSQISLSGNYEKLKAEMILELNKLVSTISITLDKPASKKLNLSFKVSAPVVDPAQLFDSVAHLRITNFRVAGRAVLNADQKLSNLSASITSDSLIINEYPIHDPAIFLNQTTENFLTTITLPELFKLRVESGNSIFNNTIRYSGSIESILPQLSSKRLKAGDFFSRFSGEFVKGKSAFDFNMKLDSVRFKPASYEQVYLSSGQISASQKQNGDLRFNLSLDNKDIIRFSTSGEFIEWLSKDDKWNNLPTTELDLAISVDSLLINQFTGTLGQLELNKLIVRAEGNKVSALLDVPVFFMNGFDVRDIKADVESSPGNLHSQLTVGLLQNPYTLLQDVKILATQKESQTMGVTITSLLPEIEDTFELNTLLSYTDSTYQINLDHNVLNLGNTSWKNLNSWGFIFDHDFNLLYGDLTIVNGKEKINVETVKGLVSLQIDSLDLEPILQVLTNDSVFQGNLNVNAHYNLKQESIDWSGAIGGIAMNHETLGTIRFEGLKDKSLLSAQVSMEETFGMLQGSIRKDENPLTYEINISSLDLDFFHSKIPSLQSAMPLSGRVNAKVKGTYDTELTSDGFFSLNNVETYLTQNKIYLKADRDTIWLKDNIASFRNFKILNKKGEALTFNGTVSLQSDAQLDLTLYSNKFRILDVENKTKNISGVVDIASDLKIKRTPKQFNVSGTFAALPNSSVNYLLETSVKLNEREKEMTFVSFEEHDAMQLEEAAVLPTKKRSKPIEWDVNLDIGKSDITVLLSEAYQDQIKMTAHGNFLVKTGSTDEPFFFGTLQSKEGSIIYDAPMVSDLNFKIENLLVNWNGELTHPRVTFLGSELFRITPKGIPGMSNNNNVVPITVLAEVNDRPIEDFNLSFDLNSTNAQVKSWINSLPADSREASAINLLLFGTLNFGEISSSSYMQGLVSKMNEISRRNIKNADLSFYVDSHNVADSRETADQLGYSLSKGILNKRMNVTIGGSLDFTGGSKSNQKKTTGIGNVQLDYIVSNSPDVSINLAQKSTYDGVINGQVAQSSVGITYLKRFRNFFTSIKGDSK